MTSLQVISIQLALPLYFCFVLWRGKFKNKNEWILLSIIATVYIAWIFQAGNWGWTGYYLRYILVVLLIISLYQSWKKSKIFTQSKDTEKNSWFTLAVYTLLIFVFSLYNVLIMTSYSTDHHSINLTFPLKNGTYYVGQGGDAEIMNYHHVYLPQQYALDIVELNQIGTRASGLYPKDLKDYEIYGENLVSPCDGVVIETRNHLPDLIPPNSDSERPEGNYVALTCEQYNDIVIYMAHMKQHSIEVSEGDKVNTGQRIGVVGNSGNTTEPHLHIHAEKNGVGIPIRFNERFLVRNSLIKF